MLCYTLLSIKQSAQRIGSQKSRLRYIPLSVALLSDSMPHHTASPASMSNSQILSDISELKLEFPPSEITTSALLFAQKHLSQGVFNHVARTAYWALILSRRLSSFTGSPRDIEAVVLTCVLHDMGLAFATSSELEGLSVDKRFEVDGANIAKDFIRSHVDKESWGEARLERLWTAIALHTTPSVARHAAPEIALTQMAIEADFAGPYWSPVPGGAKGQWITVDEYRAVTKLFPRVDFDRDGTKRLLCGLCNKKPETTYDNFLGGFGVRYGIDGEGGGKAEYTSQWEKHQFVEQLLSGLEALEALEKSL